MGPKLNRSSTFNHRQGSNSPNLLAYTLFRGRYWGLTFKCPSVSQSLAGIERKCLATPSSSDRIVDFGRKHNVDLQGLKDQFTLVVNSIVLIRDELNKDGRYALIGSPNPPLSAVYVARNY